MKLLISLVTFCAASLAAAGEPVDLLALTSWKHADGWMSAAAAEASATAKEWIRVEPGTGILCNGEAGKARDLASVFEHGDVEAEIEFLIPKGSNSGVYFQNRYEIQILDSFGKPDAALSHADNGGIYQRWDESRDPKGYEGTKPLANASRAPGEWQTLHVIFRAPRFAADGSKTEDARFELVELNGTVIHRDVAVSGPTRGGLGTEVPKGPVRLQGDHGPVAFRKLLFRPLAAE
jgi:hypothetical protein